jgi:tetratricopeptide (TPR) repeat protein
MTAAPDAHDTVPDGLQPGARSGRTRTVHTAPEGTAPTASCVEKLPRRSRVPLIIAAGFVGVSTLGLTAFLVGRQAEPPAASTPVASVAVTAPPAAVPASPAEDADSKAKALAQKAQVHFDLGEYTVAAQAFRESYRLRPTPALLLRLGEAMEHLRRPKDAAAYFGKYLAAQPDAPDRDEVRRRIEGLTAKADAPTSRRRARTQTPSQPPAQQAPVAAPPERIAPPIDQGGTAVRR